MKIDIKSGDFRMKLPLPPSLAFNRLTAYFGKKALTNSPQPEIPPEKIEELFALLRKMSKQYPGLLLIEVEEQNGDHVYIYL